MVMHILCNSLLEIYFSILQGPELREYRFETMLRIQKTMMMAKV